MQEKDGKMTREEELDRFWDIGSLLPRSKKISYPSANTDTTEIELSEKPTLQKSTVRSQAIPKESEKERAIRRFIPPHTAEEEQALINDESCWLMTLTVTLRDSDGTRTTKVCSFYQVASRKAYLTINGNGGFYVNKNRVDKFLTDAERFFNMELIVPTDKR